MPEKSAAPTAPRDSPASAKCPSEPPAIFGPISAPMAAEEPPVRRNRNRNQPRRSRAAAPTAAPATTIAVLSSSSGAPITPRVTSANPTTTGATGPLINTPMASAPQKISAMRLVWVPPIRTCASAPIITATAASNAASVLAVMPSKPAVCRMQTAPSRSAPRETQSARAPPTASPLPQTSARARKQAGRAKSHCLRRRPA